MSQVKCIKKRETVPICFASDDNYAPYVRITIYSLLCNRNVLFGYDIIILHSNISEENQRKILDLTDGEQGVSIRFIDVTEMEEMVNYKFYAYYSIATNYRLFVFSELFQEYNKIIYLDCDMIVMGDISKLFHIDMKGMPLAAVEAVGMTYLEYTKAPLFIDGKVPYKAENYRKFALGMENPKEYFNAGVLLFDLEKCRKMYSFQKVADTLHSKHFAYNDQDVLNLLFSGHTTLIDCVWNYQNNIDVYLTSPEKEFTDLFKKYKRADYQIIHYVGLKKPWNHNDVMLGDCYKYYENKIQMK